MHLHAHSEPSWSCFANKKKKEKNSYTKNYFDASDLVSLLCSLQGVIILDELRMLEQTVNFLL